MAIDLTKPAVTSLTIEPQNRKPFEYTTGKKVAATEAEFLGHENGFGFSDFLDIINPLQHIPIVSNVYRAITGDEVSTGAKVLGGGLFGVALGGVTGLVASIANEIFEGETGKDTGDTLIAMMTGSGSASSTVSSAARQDVVAAGIVPSSSEIPASAAAQDLAPVALGGVTGKQALSRYREAQMMANLQDTMMRVAFASEDKKAKEENRAQPIASDWQSVTYQDWLAALTTPNG